MMKMTTYYSSSLVPSFVCLYEFIILAQAESVCFVFIIFFLLFLYLLSITRNIAIMDYFSDALNNFFFLFRFLVK